MRNFFGLALFGASSLLIAFSGCGNPLGSDYIQSDFHPTVSPTIPGLGIESELVFSVPPSTSGNTDTELAIQPTISVMDVTGAVVPTTSARSP